jgi:hypothetical protein
MRIAQAAFAASLLRRPVTCGTLDTVPWAKSGGTLRVMDPPTRILLPRSPTRHPMLFPLAQWPDADNDLSLLGFFASELIALSAARLAVDPESRVIGNVESLPRVIRDRIDRVDQHRDALEKATAVLLPVYRDLGIDPAAYPPFSDEPEILLWSVREDLDLLLIGYEHRAHVGVKPLVTSRRIGELRALCTRADSEAALASILGVFATYREAETPSLVRSPSAPEDLSEEFGRLVENETYRAMSRAAGLLGTFAHLTHVLIRMKRHATELLANERIAVSLELSSRLVHVAQPVADTTEPGMLRRLLRRQRYLPPLIDVDDATIAALGRFHRRHPVGHSA